MIKSEKISFFAKLNGFLKLARPKQWIKNLFVFAALVFAGHAFEEEYLQKTTLAFLLFCLISACVYILNDVVDINKDRAHPKKRTRPIAAGIITPKEAIIFLIILLPLSLAASFKVDLYLGIVLVVYFLNNLFYSLVVKHWVILDVMSIALGFLLRVIGGALVIKVYISPWILLCTLLLSLFLGFSKRRNELMILQEDAGSHRKILKEYSLEFIDNMLSIVTASTVMAYSLYTFSSNSENYYMMATIPFVLWYFQIPVYNISKAGREVQRRLCCLMSPYDKYIFVGGCQYSYTVFNLNYFFMHITSW